MGIKIPASKVVTARRLAVLRSIANVLGLGINVVNTVNAKTVQILDNYLFNIYFCGFKILFYKVFLQ